MFENFKMPMLGERFFFCLYFKRFKKKMLNDLQKRLQETWTVEKAQISNWVLLEGLKLLKVGASILNTF